MIATQKTHTLVRSHDFEESEFGIDQEDISFVIDLLRNQIYSNKPLAVIREYTTNAIDAHAEVGKPDLPVKVTLPTKFEPTFKVRDYGTGLTDEEIRNLYTRYCKSTKRNSNAFTGQLGIGCKAGFAYGDNFGVISYNNGTKNSYNAQIDESSKGKIILMDSSPTTEKDGMEIVISVADNDVDTFREESLKLFRYFKLTPDIKNLGEDKIEEKSVALSGECWKLYEEEGNGSSYSYYHRQRNYGSRNQTIAIMGNIGYPIDHNSIQNLDGKYQDILCLDNLWVEFDIGELNISPSREGLEYTKRTQQAIKDKIEVIKTDLEKIAQEKLGDASDYYEAKCNYASIVNSLPYSIQEVLKGSFKWKGINIDSPVINKPRTDWQTPEITIRHYWKEDDSANTDGFKVKSKLVDRFTCHKDNLLAINDCPSNHGLALKARTLFKENSDANNVYMIWFRDSAWKKKFYDEHEFNKVDDNRINYFSKVDKSKSGYVSAGGASKLGAGSRQHVKMFQLKDDGENRTDQNNWDDLDKDDVPTEGIYVPILRYGIVDATDKKVMDTMDIVNFLKSSVVKDKLQIKVYGVRRKDVEKLDDSKWTHFKVWLKQNLDKVITPELWQRYANERSMSAIANLNYINCEKFIEQCKKHLDDSHILMRAIKYLPPMQNGNYVHATLNKVQYLLTYLLGIDRDAYSHEWSKKQQEPYKPELTKEMIEKNIDSNYPMMEMIEFYGWRFSSDNAEKVVNYIKQTDELNSTKV